MKTIAIGVGENENIIQACHIFKEKHPKTDIILIYNDEDDLKDKVKKVAREIYRATDVEFSDLALSKLQSFDNNNIKKMPICIAKTQYSFSDDPKKVGAPTDFKIYVKDICLYNGAGFITVLLGDIMTMPGLSRKPSYEKIDFINGNIVGLS